MILNKYVAPLLVFTLLLGFLGQAISKQSDADSMLVGKAIPDFKLPTVEDQSSEVTQEIFQNKVTVLHVWATWCKVCIAENTKLKTLSKTGDFELVGLSYKNSQNSADQWLNKHGNPYTVNILDAQGRLGKKLGIRGTPATYVIDRYGIIRYVHVGSLTDDIWRTEVLPEINSLGVS